MPTVRDEAICIRHWDWSETSQTVSLFCRGLGVLRCVAKGSKRDKAPFSGGIELLTRGDAMAIVKASGAMATLTSWDLAETFGGFRRSLDRLHAGMYMIDLVHHAVQGSDPHPLLYDALVEALRRVGGQERPAADPGLPVLAFQWALLVETGHKPEVTAHVRTGAALAPASLYGFDPALGGIVDDPGAIDAPAWRVRAETIDLLARLDSDNTLEAKPDAIRRANRLLAAYARERLEAEPASMKVYLGRVGRG